MGKLRYGWVIVPWIAAALTAAAANAETAAEFYAHTTVRLLSTADPGGSYDSNARLLGRHLGVHLPGSPRIVVEQMPGASGRLGANYLYGVAPKDGSVIAIVQQSLPMAQVMGESGVQYDGARLNWIGSAILLDDVLVVWHTTGVRSIEDAKKKSIVIGATTATGTNYIYPKLTNELLGTKFKIVTGYAGASAIKLALERGEVQGHGSNPWSDWKLTRPQWIQEKKIIPLMQMSLEKHRDLPDVPRLIDLATTPDVKAVFELMSLTADIGRPFVTAPDVPPDRVAALRQAFAETMKDPEFLADAAKNNIEIRPVYGQELGQLVARVLASPRSAVALLKSVLAR
ncbi:MAG TPA: tripartite tricarboxylate transporter substrate-binding protein [Xanthobacteraceae bacterium]|jgi:tripartite-type tricarboxylate transporter receptor subunit TctC